MKVRMVEWSYWKELAVIMCTSIFNIGIGMQCSDIKFDGTMRRTCICSAHAKPDSYSIKKKKKKNG